MEKIHHKLWDKVTYRNFDVIFCNATVFKMKISLQLLYTTNWILFAEFLRMIRKYQYKKSLQTGIRNLMVLFSSRRSIDLYNHQLPVSVNIRV